MVANIKEVFLAGSNNRCVSAVPVFEGFQLANFVYISKFPRPFSLFLVTLGVIVINISHFVYRREMRGRALDFVVKFSTKLMESPIRLQPLFSENHSNFKDSIRFEWSGYQSLRSHVPISPFSRSVCVRVRTAL